jgi:hypothetical protein
VVFVVLVGIDVVDVMAAYQPVAQACGSTARLRNRRIRRHNIDYVYTDEHNKNHTCSFS